MGRGDLIVKLATQRADGRVRAENESDRPEARPMQGLLGATMRLFTSVSEGLAGAMRGLEARMVGLIQSERRQHRGPLVVQLGELSQAVERAGGSEISRLLRLESKLSANVARLQGIEAPAPIRSAHDAALVLESARRARDGIVASTTLLALACALGAVNVLALLEAIRLVVPDPSLFQFPALFEDELLLPLGLTISAFGSGVIAQALEREDGREHGARPVGEPSTRTTLSQAGPFVLTLGLVTIEVLLFASLAEVMDLTALLGLEPDSMLSLVSAYVIVLAGVVIPLALVSLGSGFWMHLRTAYGARAQNRIGRSLRQHLRRLRSLPVEVEGLHRRLSELASTLDGMSRRLSATFERATGFRAADGTVAGGLLQAVERLTSNEADEAHAPTRSREEALGGLAV